MLIDRVKHLISLPIVLASSSLYRRALLQRLGISFRCLAPEVDESRHADETPEQLCARLSLAKTDAVAARLDQGLVIGSDQVACANGELIGKPGNHPRAAEQLRTLSGTTCEFLTGLSVLNIATGCRYAHIDRTVVRFRELGDDEIERYLLLDQPYHCAGSFKSEAAGVGLLEWQRSDDPTALVGLPLQRLAGILRIEGVPLFVG